MLDRSGAWIITIEGSGPYHNAKGGDADMISRTIVQTLRDHGQDIHRATFRGLARDVIFPERK